MDMSLGSDRMRMRTSSGEMNAHLSGNDVEREKYERNGSLRSLRSLSFDADNPDEQAEDELEIGQVIEHIGFGRFQYKIILVGGLLLAADAMEMMLLSFLGPSIRCEFGVSREKEALLTTIVFLGAVIGSYVCGVMADKYGRRRVLKWVAIWTFLLGISSAFSPNYWCLLLSRGLMGFCLGGASHGFSYMMEMLPTHNRGRWGILLELFWTLGTFLESGLGWIVFGTSTQPGAWRWLLAWSAVPVLLAAICFMLKITPESPRFLLTQGDTIGAYRILERAAAENGKTMPCTSLKPVYGGDQSPRGNPLNCLHTFKSLFTPSLRRITSFLWFIWFTNSFVYYGVILMTTSLAFVQEDNEKSDKLFCDPVTKSPFGDSSAFTEVYIASCSELPGVLFAAFLVDSALGRRYSQSLCFTGTFVALLLLLLLPISSTSDTICLFFARGLVDAAFVLTYVYTPEVYPTTIRGTAFGIAVAISRVGGMAAPFVGQDLIERGERKTALLIFSICVGCAAFATVLLPIETKGRNLQDTTDEYVGIELASTVAVTTPTSPIDNELDTI
mmetsp:Transcript_8378/g.13588  ORF Transcript_8378/g.13588 Transcript_8378/m.13588 type:complete len:558 (-) Transcript_8378:454-2127(-)